MFDIQLFIVLLGLTGAIMVLRYSPQVESRTFLYTDSEMKKIIARDRRKRRLSRIGLFFILAGSLLQLILLIADRCKFL